ncbi:hypothetical protein B0A54_06220 [Friedmanniomyces endolithicus]|uniref:TauD/TfdA-like domain-containing protein n=1 Tax=Friedmanniomyces endolithicus TaxID=329885 RepID=A0A4U0UYK6_9PEZI|nr:hypothetical protein B0A54_06220 [Friedmanniomyces endolithicus]
MPHKEESQLEIVELHPTFAAEVRGTNFHNLGSDVFDEIHAAITKLGKKHRLAFDQLFDVSNLLEDGSVAAVNSHRAAMNKGNSLFHVDSSFNPRRAGYSLLKAHELPPKGTGGATEYADTRTAFDELPEELKKELLEQDYHVAGMARTGQAAGPGRPPNEFEPTNPTRQLPSESESPLPARGIKHWYKRHIWSRTHSKKSDSSKLFSKFKHTGRRLHKEPPPRHPSRALPQPQHRPTEELSPTLTQPALLQPPPPERSPSRASTFGLTSFINNFKHETERSFLTPLEKEVYNSLTQVTGRGRLTPAFSPTFAARLVLPDRDSTDALASVQHLTREFPDYQKELLCRDLRNFLTGDQRRVLRVVLFRNVEVFCEGDEEGTVGREGQPLLRASPAREVVVVEARRASSTNVVGTVRIGRLLGSGARWLGFGRYGVLGASWRRVWRELGELAVGKGKVGKGKVGKGKVGKGKVGKGKVGKGKVGMVRRGRGRRGRLRSEDCRGGD